MQFSTIMRIAITTYGVFALALCLLAIRGAPRNSMLKDPEQMVTILRVLGALVFASLLWLWLQRSRGAVVAAVCSSIAATLGAFSVFLA